MFTSYILELSENAKMHFMVFHQKSFAFPEENVSIMLFLLLCSPTLLRRSDVAACYGGTKELHYRSGPYSDNIAKEPRPQTSKNKSVSADKNKKIQWQEKQKLQENSGRGKIIQLFVSYLCTSASFHGLQACGVRKLLLFNWYSSSNIFPSLCTIYQNLAHFSVQFQAFLRTGARCLAMLLLSCSISHIRDSQLDSVVFSSTCCL